MHWPTLQQWLSAVQRARLIAAVTWVIVTAIASGIWWWTSNSIVAIAFTAFTMIEVIVLATLEVISDHLESRIDDRAVAEFGRQRFAEVNRSFPRPEGIDALAKDKQGEALRPVVQKSWKLRVVSEQPPEADTTGADSDASGDGGADGEESEEDFH